MDRTKLIDHLNQDLAGELTVQLGDMVREESGHAEERAPAEGLATVNRIEPGPGQESVWDYPRPPRIESTDKLVQVFFNGKRIAETWQATRVLETSHPPTYYIPPDDVDSAVLASSSYRTFCEFKGNAIYHSLDDGNHHSPDAAWSYPQPVPAFESIRHHIAFYPSRVEACFVDGEQVLCQEGDFYGGWITRNIVGPFKGSSGTWGW